MTEVRARILIVDDDDAKRYTIARQLARSGFELTEASGGKEALKHAFEQSFDLIVLDVKLPDVSGLEVCRQLKANGETRHIPVVQLSATFVDVQDRVEGLESGADAYLTDVANPNELIATIRALLRARRAERELHQTEERFSFFVRHVLEYAIFTCDAGGRISDWNEGVERVLGYSSDHFVGKDISALFQDEELAAQQLDQAREQGHLEFESWQPRADGSRFYVSGSITSIQGNHGSMAGFVVVLRDITERRQAEEQIRESEQRFRRMADTAPAMLWLTNPEGDCVFLSRGWHEFTGQPVEQGLGRGWLDLVHPEDRRALYGIFQEATAALREFSTDFRLPRGEGGYGWCNIAGRPRQDRAGDYEGYIGSVIDITERKNAERSLEETKLLAEAANRAKSEFLANMSHEIRTPMTSILGYAEILEAKDFDEDSLECVRTIRRNGEFLLQLINDILDLSRIESGKPVVNPERFVLPDLLKEIHALMELRASEKGLRFTFAGPERIPEKIVSDPVRLKQILINLIGNAIKFTETGGVELAVRARKEEDLLRIEVTDSGIGMSVEQQQLLFQPFTQADASITRNFGGTGLGLSISQRLAHLLGGAIVVDSELGKGSTFTLTITTGSLADVPFVPLLPSEASEEASEAEIELSCRILAVDDRRDVRLLIKRFVEGAGGLVEFASNGQKAVEIVDEQRERGHPAFDLVLMDMQMPVMDGYTAANRLRRGGYRGPIIALSANAMKEDRKKCLKAGCDDYLTKPVERDALLQLLARYAPD